MSGMGGSTGGGRGRLVGKLFRALGFRWVFPIGTMPIPSHRFLAWALLIAAPAWLAIGLVQSVVAADRPSTWLQMLVVGLLLGVPMSIPIVSWAGLVFRVPLIQSLLFASATILLAVDVGLGRAHPALAALPAGYLGLWLYQWLGGRLRLRALRRAGEAFEPVSAGQRTVFPAATPCAAGRRNATVPRSCTASPRPTHGPCSRSGPRCRCRAGRSQRRTASGCWNGPPPRVSARS